MIETEDKVVIDNGNLVFGEHNVELDHLGAAVVGLAERLDRVLHEMSPGQRAVRIEGLAHAAVADRYARAVKVVVEVLADVVVG